MDWRWRSWNANPRSSKSSNSIYHQIFNRGRHNNTANNNRSASHKKVLIQTADYNHHEYAIELLPWKYDWPARIKGFSKTQCCFPLVLCMFCLFHVFILLKCWHLAENMLLFPKVPLILWIGYKQSTRCGRVHFEHSTGSGWLSPWDPPLQWGKVRKRIYRPATHPIHFAAVSPDKIHRYAAWAVFFFYGKRTLKISWADRTWYRLFVNAAAQTGAGTSFGANGDQHTWAAELSTYFLRLNNSETFADEAFWAQR